MDHWDLIPSKPQILRSQVCLRSDNPLLSRTLRKQEEARRGLSRVTCVHEWPKMITPQVTWHYRQPQRRGDGGPGRNKTGFPCQRGFRE